LIGTGTKINVGMLSFKPSQAWEGGAEGDGWVVLQIQVENEIKGRPLSGSPGAVGVRRNSLPLKE